MYFTFRPLRHRISEGRVGISAKSMKYERTQKQLRSNCHRCDPLGGQECSQTPTDIQARTHRDTRAHAPTPAPAVARFITHDRTPGPNTLAVLSQNSLIRGGGDSSERTGRCPPQHCCELLPHPPPMRRLRKLHISLQRPFRGRNGLSGSMQH